MTKKRTFEVGDHINIDTAAGFKGRAEIVAIRHQASGGTDRLFLGADVLRSDGKVTFYYLHDIVRWNPEAMAAGIGK